jgi:ATP-binding cassette, subfamily B, bacterial
VKDGDVLKRLRSSNQWRFFGVLRRAAPGYAAAWWVLLVLRGLLPALLALATGALIGAVADGRSLTAPLVFVGVVFVAFQLLTPLQQAVGANLGSRTSAWLNDRLMRATLGPPGIGHLERPELTTDLTVARDFDLGIMGPPLSISMDFIASGLVELVAGAASAIVLARYAWWAPLLLVAAWASTHWLLRESGVWRDRNTDEVRNAQRHADYAYRLAVDPPAAKELRLFGLAGWVVERFADRRRRLYELQWRATRLREKSVLGCLVIVVAANVVVFWSLARAVSGGSLSLAGVVVYLQTAIGTSMIAFGGLSWAPTGRRRRSARCSGSKKRCGR